MGAVTAMPLLRRLHLCVGGFPLKRAVLRARPVLKNLRMARGAHFYRRFSVDHSTDLGNLDEALENIRERRIRLEKRLIAVLLIAVSAVCAVIVAAFH